MSAPTLNLDEDDRFGLRLHRARFHLVPDEIVAPCIIASDRRHALGRRDFVPGNPWRYETFVIPPDGTAERWATWENRQADALVDAEAERQNAWLAVSLELRARLEDGRLEGFARRNDIAAEYQPIRAGAWPLLRVPFDANFTNWKNGYAEGAGLKLWDIRIIDRSGLHLAAAAIAYGPAADAARAQRGRAYRAAGVDDCSDGAELVRVDDATYKGNDAEAVEARLSAALVANLQDGKLIGFGRVANGGISAIARADWQRGTVSVETSELRVSGSVYTNVVVRPLHPSAERPAGGTLARAWAPSDVSTWWQERIVAHPDGRWQFNEDEDWVAAKNRFPGIKRDYVRDLRQEIKPRITHGRRKKGNPR